MQINLSCSIYHPINRPWIWIWIVALQRARRTIACYLSLNCFVSLQMNLEGMHGKGFRAFALERFCSIKAEAFEQSFATQRVTSQLVPCLRPHWKTEPSGQRLQALIVIQNPVAWWVLLQIFAFHMPAHCSVDHASAGLEFHLWDS